MTQPKLEWRYVGWGCLELAVPSLPGWNHMMNSHHQHLHVRIASQGFQRWEVGQVCMPRGPHSIQRMVAVYRSAHKRSKFLEGLPRSQQR